MIRPSLPPVTAALVVLAALVPGTLVAQDWNTVTASRALTGEDDARVEIVYAAGEFSLQAGESGRLYRMGLRYDRDQFDPVTEYSNSLLRIGISNKGRRSVSVKKAGSLEVALNPDIPLDLNLELGAVSAEIDLTGLQLEGLEVGTAAAESAIRIDEPNPIAMEVADFNVGAADFEIRGVGNLNAATIDVEAGVGAVTISLDGAWEQNALLDLKMGLGALRLRIPEELGVKLVRSSFLTSLDAEGLVKRGDAYYSVNWEGSERRVEIQIAAALGSVEISTIP